MLSRSIAAAVLVLLAWLVPTDAEATVIGATASPFTGSPLSVSVSVDDAIDPGNLVITLEVIGTQTGDLRGFFAHVSDESLLPGLSVTGTGVTDSQFSANDVINLGGGNNLNGGGTPCECDLGVEIGTSGIGSDDIQMVVLTLSHVSQNLDVSLFQEQDFGVRATSVGPLGGSRDGSSKLSGTIPVPEPSTAVLMLLGLAGIASTKGGLLGFCSAKD